MTGFADSIKSEPFTHNVREVFLVLFFAILPFAYAAQVVWKSPLPGAIPYVSLFIAISALAATSLYFYSSRRFWLGIAGLETAALCSHGGRLPGIALIFSSLLIAFFRHRSSVVISLSSEPFLLSLLASFLVAPSCLHILWERSPSITSPR